MASSATLFWSSICTVEEATGLGMLSYHFRGAEGLRRALEAAGLLEQE